METSLFRFVTVRNPTTGTAVEPRFEIKPQTALVSTLAGILNSKGAQADKIKAFNQALEIFIKGGDFFKTKRELLAKIEAAADAQKTEKAGSGANAEELKRFYQTLYDNIVVRTVTKSNANEVFKLLVDTIKPVHQKLNAGTVSLQDVPELKIILAEDLIFSFSPPRPPAAPVVDDRQANQALIDQVNELAGKKQKIAEELERLSHSIALEQKSIARQRAEVGKNIQLAPVPQAPQKRAVPDALANALHSISTKALDDLLGAHAALTKADEELNARLGPLYAQSFQLVPWRKFSSIGYRYVDTTRIKTYLATAEKDSTHVYSSDCHLKFPFQIADLRVVEQKTVAYVPGEIAHVNNTQSNERNEKVTRRLKRVETFDSLITEDEVTKETDTQSTEKFSLEKAVSDVQAEETALNVNASVSGTYGAVTASLDAGASHSNSSTNANSSSQSYAKEIVQRTVDRVSHKVRSERSVKSIEEFEETVTHIIDNTASKSPKSYVYRWLTKLVRATLKNYGKRLMFQIDVPHPSHYYLTRAEAEGDDVELPPHPLDWKKESSDKLVIDFFKKYPSFPHVFGVGEIRRDNYLFWAELYKAKLEQPPAEKNFLAVTEIKDVILTVPEGYMASKAHIQYVVMQDGHGYAYLDVLLGRTHLETWVLPAMHYITDVYEARDLDGETQAFPISFFSPANNGLKFAIEIECVLTKRAMEAWQMKCYDAILDAYESMKTEADNKMSGFDPNNPGLNPGRKTELIRTELKKGALLRMFRCNPFWLTDGYKVGTEYDPDCCKDSLNAEKIRFLETTFDWKNMTYELYPYFYSNQDVWRDLMKNTDDDPHFEAFLQSSYASICLPVFRDGEKEKAAINFLLYNSFANFSVQPDNMQHIFDDLKTNTPFGYTTETPTDIPFIQIRKEYDRKGSPKIYYKDGNGNEVICTEALQFDKEGNETIFYYNAVTGEPVISEMKEGINQDGQKYSYYFNSADEKIVTHRTKTGYDIDGNTATYYATDLGVFPVPTDLVILEAGGVENGIEVNGFPEDNAPPAADVLIPRQYSPAIIKK